MRILYIYPELTIKGGADKIIIEKANYFATHGYDVIIVTESQMGRQTAFSLHSAAHAWLYLFIPDVSVQEAFVDSA